LVGLNNPKYDTAISQICVGGTKMTMGRQFMCIMPPPSCNAFLLICYVPLVISVTN